MGGHGHGIPLPLAEPPTPPRAPRPRTVALHVCVAAAAPPHKACFNCGNWFHGVRRWTASYTQLLAVQRLHAVRCGTNCNDRRIYIFGRAWLPNMPNSPSAMKRGRSCAAGSSAPSKISARASSLCSRESGIEE